MHIPDGYLSPSTCATLYAFAAAGWYSALRRIKHVFAARTVPLISVFAAFSFIVMMFNVPLPGGTTGHALGVTVGVIVLGPAGAILAVSIALAIQALLFGDGGITTLGANCFNIAIVGSLVAYGVYQLVAKGSDVSSRRRVIAAAIAGYTSINVCALVTAIEFGIQPAFFHDAAGTPLYAPYPLRVAVPAMMIGHLTFAGLAEAAVSAGMVSYLQSADIGLLRGMVPAKVGAVSGPDARRAPGRLWWAVGLLMLCTPLGILAAGSAWGEWSSRDLSARMQDQRSNSGDQARHLTVPTGMQRLASIWTAPFPGYAPRFIRSPMLGYFLSAMFAVGLLVLVSLIGVAVERRS
jgi:cobalt/nickel transport system permease protein